MARAATRHPTGGTATAQATIDASGAEVRSSATVATSHRIVVTSDETQVRLPQRPCNGRHGHSVSNVWRAPHDGLRRPTGHPRRDRRHRCEACSRWHEGTPGARLVLRLLPISKQLPLPVSRGAQRRSQSRSGLRGVGAHRSRLLPSSDLGRTDGMSRLRTRTEVWRPRRPA